MNDVMQALREQVRELHSIVSDLDEGQLASASGCPGWSLSDVLLHLAQTNEAAAASARGRATGLESAVVTSERAMGADFDAIAGRFVEHQRGAGGLEVRARWAKSADDMADALEACDLKARLHWAVGDMAPRTLATARIAETWIHTGDVCVGLGIVQPRSDRIWHIARLVHQTLPYSFARAGRQAKGEVRFELTSPTDASAVWRFGGDGAGTIIAGPAVELCQVAGQRASAAETSLRGVGPDADDVLRLVRTFA